MSLANYVDRITGAGTSNDLYLVANNNFLDRPDVAALKDDFESPALYLDPNDTKGKVFFWFGPGGTITPLHHDVMNVMLLQVYGHKRVVLVPSLQTHRVYNDLGVFSEVDPDHLDTGRFPLFEGATRYEVPLGPGEALFVPVGWWHRVEALDTSISLSFTNFAFPNDFTWEHPAISR